MALTPTRNRLLISETPLLDSTPVRRICWSQPNSTEVSQSGTAFLSPRKTFAHSPPKHYGDFRWDVCLNSPSDLDFSLRAITLACVTSKVWTGLTAGFSKMCHHWLPLVVILTKDDIIEPPDGKPYPAVEGSVLKVQNGAHVPVCWFDELVYELPKVNLRREFHLPMGNTCTFPRVAHLVSADKPFTAQKVLPEGTRIRRGGSHIGNTHVKAGHGEVMDMASNMRDFNESDDDGQDVADTIYAADTEESYDFFPVKPQMLEIRISEDSPPLQVPSGIGYMPGVRHDGTVYLPADLRPTNLQGCQIISHDNFGLIFPCESPQKSSNWTEPFFVERLKVGPAGMVLAGPTVLAQNGLKVPLGGGAVTLPEGRTCKLTKKMAVAEGQEIEVPEDIHVPVETRVRVLRRRTVVLSGEDGDNTQSEILDNYGWYLRPAGSVIRRGKVLLGGSILPAGTVLPGGMSIPPGTQIPGMTTLPEGTSIPPGTEFPPKTWFGANRVIKITEESEYEFTPPEKVQRGRITSSSQQI